MRRLAERSLLHSAEECVVAMAVADDSLWTIEGNAIRRVSLDTGRSTTVAGTSEAGFRDGAGHAARFHGPFALSSWHGGMYVSDTDNDAIRKIGLSDGAVETVLRGHIAPTGLTWLDDRLLFWDLSSAERSEDPEPSAPQPPPAQMGNGRLMQWEPASRALATIVQNPDGYVDGPTGLARFGALPGPWGAEAMGFAVHAHRGNALIADAGNDAIRAYDPDTSTIQTLASGNPPLELAGAGFFDPWCLAGEGDGVWFGTPDGLFILDLASGFVRQLERGRYRSMAVARGSLFASTDEAVYRWDIRPP